MAGFSPRSLKTIEDFANALQMVNLRAADDGSYSFAFEHAGVMSLTPSSDGKRAIVSLKRMPSRPPLVEDLEGFLGLAQFDPITRTSITAGMAADGAFILASSIGEDDFDLPKIEACLDRLIELHSAGR